MVQDQKVEDKIDEDGNIVIGENVKLILSANITSVGDIITE